ncbi:MAG TPA: D-Ala-D-Ala carboxypeptidase family metallohydrolase, partial [Gemmatimonadales bacterium]
MRTRLSTTAVALLAAIGVVHFYRPERPLLDPPFVAHASDVVKLPFATPAEEAYGRSGAVRMHFALPSTTVSLPLVFEDTIPRAAFSYQWLRTVDSVAVGAPLPLGAGDEMAAPAAPGYYRLALLREGDRRVVDGQTLAVLVPFEEKKGSRIHGFDIGTWVGERLRGRRATEIPEGFLPVDEHALSLSVTESLTLGDVLSTPDTEREGYPAYAALDTRLLDKLELVLAEVGRLAGDTTTPRLSVNSGFRPPSYNRNVPGAARNSRHQYGDAADVRIDVNGDGRFTRKELDLVVKAVAAVEREHPDLVGGLGL